MPTEQIFTRYPPFPSEIPSIDLERLSSDKLMKNDAIKSKKLFKASQDTIFFLVDLKGSKHGETMFKHAKNASGLNKQIHELEQAELKLYAFKHINGYMIRLPISSCFTLSPISFNILILFSTLPTRSTTQLLSTKRLSIDTQKQVRRQHQARRWLSDRTAFYNLNQDNILGNITPGANPQIVETHRQTFKNFFVHGHHILSHILTHLDTHLDLPTGTLASFSPLDRASGTSLRLLEMLPSGADSKARTDFVGHTDMGSITMLFNVVGGLQTLDRLAPDPPAESDWRFVRPVPNCALINLGDAMARWSGGVVRSSMHRVVTAPGEQKRVERFSVAHLVRWALETSMRRLVGGKVIPAVQEAEEEEDISAKDWERARAVQLMNGKNKPGSVGGRTMNKEVGMAKIVAD